MQKSLFLPIFRLLLLPFVHCYVIFFGCLLKTVPTLACVTSNILTSAFSSLNFLTRVQHFLFITFHIYFISVSSNSENEMVGAKK